MFSNSKHKVEWGNGLDREAGARDIMRSLVAYWKQRHRESRKRVAGWRARRGVQGARDLSLSQKRAGRKARARRILGNEDTRRGQRWMKEFWREVQKPLEKRRKKRKRERKKERKKGKEEKNVRLPASLKPGAHTLALPNSRIRIGGRECRAIFQWLRPSLNSR